MFPHGKAGFATVDEMKMRIRTGRINLKIKRSRLDGTLLVGGQSRQAVDECVGDTELHAHYPSNCADSIALVKPVCKRSKSRWSELVTVENFPVI